jgi:hypothetical protein
MSVLENSGKCRVCLRQILKCCEAGMNANLTSVSRGKVECLRDIQPAAFSPSAFALTFYFFHVTDLVNYLRNFLCFFFAKDVLKTCFRIELVMDRMHHSQSRAELASRANLQFQKQRLGYRTDSRRR